MREHENINKIGLVEITSVSVDKDLPQTERYAEFGRQIKDIHNYQSGTLSVRAVYADNGASIEDCLRGMMA
jgi:hypothetical protein